MKIKCFAIYLQNKDFTGSEITSTGPIFVVSGAETGRVTIGGDSETFLDLMQPISYHGREYVIAPFLYRTTGYLLKLVGKFTKLGLVALHCFITEPNVTFLNVCEFRSFSFSQSKQQCLKSGCILHMLLIQ